METVFFNLLTMIFTRMFTIASLPYLHDTGSIESCILLKPQHTATMKEFARVMVVSKYFLLHNYWL